jgi:hypothetical protein
VYLVRSSRAKLATLVVAGMGVLSWATIRCLSQSGATASKTLTLSVSGVRFDEYGGLADVPSPNGATGHFRVEKFGNRWMYVTPAGNAFWSTGVFAVVPDNATKIIAKYGDADKTWGPQQVIRLKSWGFNTILDHSSGWVMPNQVFDGWPGDHTQPQKTPAVWFQDAASYPIRNVFNYCSQPGKDFYRGLNTTYFTGYIGRNSDPFDPCFSTWINSYMGGSEAAAAAASPYIIGFSLGESDFITGFGAGSPDDFPTNPPSHNNEHLGVLVLMTSPWQTYNNYFGAFYPLDRRLYAKAQMASILQAKYGSISALNTAWGSSYTSFGTEGANYVDQIGTGDGSTLTFSKTLTHIPDKFSVWVKVAGTPVGGSGQVTQETGLYGPKIASGSVDFTTGAVTVTFASGNAPATGQAVAIDYYSGGWGHGNGLLDEDGRHPWVPTNKFTLAGASTAMKSDLDDYLYQYASQWFKIQHDAVKSRYPNALYLGPNVLGSWGTPPRRQVLQAAGKYLDVFMTQIATGSSTDQQRLDFTMQYLGDKPISDWVGFPANPDSALYAYPNPPTYLASNTQPQRATNYQNLLSWYQSATVSSTVPGNVAGVIPYVGLRWWAYVDSTGEQTNWGLVTTSNNAYDGKEAVMAAGADASGYPTGGEQKNYGDFLDTVRTSNLALFQNLVTQLKK